MMKLIFLFFICNVIGAGAYDCAALSCGNGWCSMATGTARCLCYGGYGGGNCQYHVDDAILCFDIDCYPKGICYQIGSYKLCFCEPNYYGYYCNKYDGFCPSQACLNGGSCTIDADLTYYCYCSLGYTGDLCQNEPCPNWPCVNGGTCISNSDELSYCACPPGYSGEICEVAAYVHPCDTYHYCWNGGTCLRESGTCLCTSYWEGTQCQTWKTCSMNCFNGGHCRDYGTHYQCYCPDNYWGTYCEIMGCTLDCLHDGQCIVYGTDQACHCIDPWTGPLCETDGRSAGTCNNVRCANEGTCVLQGDSAFCLCPIGYVNALCDHPLPSATDCASLICFNDSGCELIDGVPACACIPYIAGHHCTYFETDIPTSCDESIPCYNGGQCAPVTVGNYQSVQCICAGNHSGGNCEY